MKKTHKNKLLRFLTFILCIGFLLVVTGCKQSDEKIDSIPNTNIAMQFDLPELNYAYDSLEPFIDAETMEIHHTRHHNSYVNNLNAALALHPELNIPLEELLADASLIPIDIRVAVQNNGGGYYNHALYFSILEINHDQVPNGDFNTAIDDAFGSFTGFKEEFTNAASTQFGSGWAWLIVTKEGLKVVSTANQDTPLDEGIPILCIDVWEHAYYLNYQNRRSDYIQAFFNVINWDKVTELYEAAI